MPQSYGGALQALGVPMVTGGSTTESSFGRVRAVPPGDAAQAEPGYQVVCLGLADDGRRAASFSYRVGEGGKGPRSLLTVWDLASGKELRRWDLHVPLQPNRPFVRALAFTQDGKHLATANADTTAYLLECPAPVENED